MAEPGSKTCPQCGHAQAAGDFCEVCGTRLTPAATVGTPPPGATGAVPPPSGGLGASTPPPYQPYIQPAYGGYSSVPPKEPGFFARLFDFSFESFVTPSIIKVLFILYLVMVGLMAIGVVATGFMQSTVLGVFTLIIGVPVGGFIMVLTGRVWLEIVIILFRINDNLEDVARSKKAA